MISSYLSEFLSVPDKLRQIEVDNLWIQRHQKLLEEQAPEGRFMVAIGEKRIHSLNQRIGKIFNQLSECNLGFGSAPIGFHSENHSDEEAISQNLKKNKDELEEMMSKIIESERILRKHREDIIKDSIFKDFKL